MVPNLDAFASALGIYSNTGSFALTGITNNSAQGNWTTVDERDKAAFLQAAFDTDLGGVPGEGRPRHPLCRDAAALDRLHRRRRQSAARDRGQDL